MLAPLARFRGREAVDVEAGSRAVDGLQHFTGNVAVERTAPVDPVVLRQPLARRCRPHRAHRRELSLGCARRRACGKSTTTGSRPGGVHVADRLCLTAIELREQWGNVRLDGRSDLAERAKGASLAVGAEAHLVDGHGVTRPVVGRAIEDPQRKSDATAKPLLPSPDDLGGELAGRARVGRGNGVGDEGRSQRIPTELGAIDLEQVVQIRVDVRIGVVRERDRGDARVEEGLVVGVPEVPDRLRVEAVTAPVVRDVRLRVEPVAVPELCDVRAVRGHHVVDRRLHDVVHEVETGGGETRHVLCAHDADRLIGTHHVLVDVHPHRVEHARVCGEVLSLGVVLRGPPEANVALRPGQRAVRNELRERASDLQQAGAAARVVVRRVLLLLQVCAEDDILSGRWVGAGNERLDERHPGLRVLARAQLRAHDGADADERPARRDAVAQRDPLPQREDERERRVLAVDLPGGEREPRDLVRLVGAEAQEAARRRVRIRIPDHA